MRGEGIVPVMEVGNNGGSFGSGFGNNGDWAWIIILFLIFGNGRGFGNGLGGGSMSCGANTTCATPADVYNAVDQQTLISKLDQQTYGLADTFTALNNTLNSNFRGIDNAICTLGYQNQQGVNTLSSQIASCCCDLRAGIQNSITQGVMNTNSIQSQIASCCCDLEKMNLQNRFDAQTYNCNTLQAIDKLGDRIINRLTQDKIDTLQSENQALRLRASQEAQNNYLTATMNANVAEIIRRTGNDCPIPAYVVNGPTPVNFPVNCCGTFNGNNGCSCGNY